MKVRLRLYSVEPGGSVYRKTNDLECEPGRLAEILCRLSIPLAYPCGGTGRCGRCRVRLLKKSDPLYAAWTRRKAPIDDVAGYRLFPACQTFLDESALLFYRRVAGLFRFVGQACRTERGRTSVCPGRRSGIDEYRRGSYRSRDGERFPFLFGAQSSNGVRLRHCQSTRCDCREQETCRGMPS